jgi:hypothetical protein
VIKHETGAKISQPARVGFRCTKPTHCVRNRPRSLLIRFITFESGATGDEGHSALARRNTKQVCGIAAPTEGQDEELNRRTSLLASLKRSTPMLTALILICSTAIAPDLGDCTQQNATAVIRIPAEFGNPATCFMHGSAYLAETSLGQELRADDRLKVICVRSGTTPASMQHSKMERAP